MRLCGGFAHDSFGGGSLDISTFVGDHGQLILFSAKNCPAVIASLRPFRSAVASNFCLKSSQSPSQVVVVILPCWKAPLVSICANYPQLPCSVLSSSSVTCPKIPQFSRPDR